MLFKNITAYRCELTSKNVLGLLQDLNDEAKKRQYAPIMDSELATQGWISPSGDDQLVFMHNDGLVMTLAIEKRTIPTSVVNKRLAQKVAGFESENGFSPGRRARKELKDQAIDELTPQAFPILKKINLLISHKAGLLLIDSASASESDQVISALLRTTSEIPLTSLQFEMPITTRLLDWVSDTAPADFTVDDSIKLESSTGKVKFTDTRIDKQELDFRIAAGHYVTELGMTWIDGQNLPISFSLTSGFTIRGIKYDDAITGEMGSSREDFYGNVTIGAEEMTGLVNSLLKELMDSDEDLI